ncbi:MAG: hypothetical protein Q9172_005948 [Xanthocarpia lactea]
MTPKKPPLTHFLCLPITGGQAAPQWQASLQQFRNDIVATNTANSPFDAKGSNIPVEGIRPLGTLHLTIGVMSLKEPERLERAVDLLKKLDLVDLLKNGKEEEPKCVRTPRQAGEEPTTATGETGVSSLLAKPDQSASSPPLILSFTGLKSMHSSTSTSFLYTSPTDATGRLYPFCLSLKDRFSAAGFMTEEDRALKLHATILNTIYAAKAYPSKTLVQGEDGRLRVAKVEKAGTENAVDGHLTGNEQQDEGQGNEPSNQEGTKAEPLSTKSKSQPPEPKRERKGKGKKQVVRFDARDFINHYSAFVWARDVRIEKVAICEMGAKKTKDEKGKVVREDYTEIASISLP